MPSASAKLEKQASAEACDPMKHVLTIVEKKVRNLEKRKAKLDSYRHDSQNGKELNDDQKKAVEKYDQVVEVLEFAKELQKQFQSVTQQSSKAQKKSAKREQLERQHQELQRIRELMIYQDLLNSMGGDDIRKDFLNGSNGAVQLTETELNSLDELYKAICPERDLEAEESSDFEQQLGAAADHIQALLDSKNKEVFGTTYKALKETLLKIQSSNYFNKNAAAESNKVECESNQSSSEEKDTEKTFPEEQYGAHSETNLQPTVEESLLAQQSGGISVSQVERAYYTHMENSSLYTEQTRPIQEVLSIQSNLNFLQESQIEVESSHPNSSIAAPHPAVPYPNVQYSTAPSAAAGIPSQHRPAQRLNEDSAIQSGNVLMANSASVPHQVSQNIPSQVPMPGANPSVQPPAADFDPARPIPTQTYTNQSFTTAIHPMMSAVPQNYVPVTLSHVIPPPHALSPNMVIKPLPPRSSVTQHLDQTISSSVGPNPNALSLAVHGQGGGLATAAAMSQVQQQMALERDSSQTVQSANLPSQFECGDMEEGNFIDDSSNTFTNSRNVRGGAQDNSRRGAGSSAYSKAASQVVYGNDRAYQSTNNSQAYMNREGFTDESSYSSNLKRGLSSRGGARGGNLPRGASSNPRGNRTGYRN